MSYPFRPPPFDYRHILRSSSNNVYHSQPITEGNEEQIPSLGTTNDRFV